MTTTTTTTTLTDRYVDAILRRLPERQRPDIEQELRASIADAVDDRLEAGADPAEAETAVLTELGDPARLAAGYADRPLHLIGPELYPRLHAAADGLLAIVVPTLPPRSGSSVPSRATPSAASSATSIGAALTTGSAHRLLDHAGLRHHRTHASTAPDATRPWTPAALPEPPSRRARLGELIALTSVAVRLSHVLVLLSPVVSPANDCRRRRRSACSRPGCGTPASMYVLIALVVRASASLRAVLRCAGASPSPSRGSLVDIASPRAADLARHERPGRSTRPSSRRWAGRRPPCGGSTRASSSSPSCPSCSNVIEEIGRARGEPTPLPM